MCTSPRAASLLLCALASLLTIMSGIASAEHGIPVATQAGAAATQDAVYVHLGAENSWPPYSNDQGQGISTDLINAAFANSGVIPRFQVLPYARVLHDLASGKIDGGFNVSRQATTENKYIFGKVPLLRVKAYWFFMAGTHRTIKSFNDLPDKFRVGVIRDYEYGDDYEIHRHRFSEIQVSQQSQIMRLLKQGRIDAGIMFEREADYVMQQMQLNSSLFDKRFLNHEGDVYVAFSHKSPRARWMAQQLDKGLLLLKETGEYDRILANPKY